jgi:pectate lyase
MATRDHSWWLAVAGLVLALTLAVAGALVVRERQEPTTADGAAADGDLGSEPESHIGYREQLLSERSGFGQDAGSGSLEWRRVTVTRLDDAGPGSLRDALGDGHRWVRFAPGLVGTITLRSPLEIPDHVVIDGRGADITVAAGHTLRADEGASISVEGVENAIITNLKLGPAYDSIRVSGGSTDIWLHQLSAVDADDEVISIVGGEGPTDRPDRITVSWVRFDSADRALLIGSTPLDPAHAPFHVTLHNNLFWRGSDRQPLVRFARVHAFNNWLYHWGADGTGQGMRIGNGAQLLSEGNLFDDAFGRPAIAPEDLGWRGQVRSVGDLVTGRAQLREREPEQVFDPRASYDYEVLPPGDGLRDLLRERAGWQPPETFILGGG